MSIPLRHPLRYRLEAMGARLLFGLLGAWSVDRASGFGAWLMRTFGPLTGAHRVGDINMQRALPDLDADARRAALTAAWDNLGRTMAEYPLLSRFLNGRESERVELEGDEALAMLAVLSARGEPAILACAHFGNWEVLPIAIARAMKPVTIVYRPANNPLVDAMIADVRAPYAAGLAPKGAGGAREIVSALKAGGLVAIVVDQKMNNGVEAQFFGRGAMTGPAVVKFAQRFACPVFPVHTLRTGGAHFKVIIEKPWHFSPNDDVQEALTRINQHIEGWIRRTPGQWLWMHRRWPKES